MSIEKNNCISIFKFHYLLLKHIYCNSCNSHAYVFLFKNDYVILIYHIYKLTDLETYCIMTI